MYCSCAPPGKGSWSRKSQATRPCRSPLLHEHGSNVGGRGVGDNPSLSRGARLLQCGGVYQSLFSIFKSFILGLTIAKNSRFSHQICLWLHEFGSSRDTSPDEVDEASETGDIFFVSGCQYVNASVC